MPPVWCKARRGTANYTLRKNWALAQKNAKRNISLEAQHGANKDTIHNKIELFFNAPKNPIIDLTRWTKTLIDIWQQVILIFRNCRQWGKWQSYWTTETYTMKISAPSPITGSVRDFLQLSWWELIHTPKPTMPMANN